MKDDYLEKQLKAVRVKSVFSALLFFLGILVLQYVAYLLCMFGYSIIQLVTGHSADLTQIRSDKLFYQTFMMAINIVDAILAIIWCGVVYNRSSWRIKPFRYKEILSFKYIFAYFAMGAGFNIVVTIILIGLQSAFPNAFVDYESQIGNLVMDNAAIAMFYTIIVGPIAEELIFRGVIYDKLRLGLPYWMANMIQAALFAIYHTNIIQGIYVFVAGCILGWVVLKTKSIVPGMLIHIFLNFTSLVLGVCNITFKTTDIAIFFFLEIISVILLIVSIKILKEVKNTNEMV